MSKKHLAGLLLLAGWPIACATKEEPTALETPSTPVYESSRELSTMATVESINLPERRVTLKGPHGNTFTVAVDEKVRNLEQVKEGDQVAVTYVEAAAVKIVKKAEKDREEVVVDQAPPGARPEGGVYRYVTLTTEVLAIDKVRGAVTLKGLDGEPVTVFCRPGRVSGLKVGDLLGVTYGEGVALSLEPASAEAK